MNHHCAINRLYNNIYLLGPCLLLTATLLLIVACGGTQINKDNWISLKNGAPVQGTQSSVDGVVEYEVVFKRPESGGPGTIDINGKVIPARGLDSLDVNINFLDASGKRIDVKSIYSSGAGRGTPQRTFAYTFKIPAGTESIAFSFSGREPIDRF